MIFEIDTGKENRFRDILNLIKNINIKMSKYIKVLIVSLSALVFLVLVYAGTLMLVGPKKELVITTNRAKLVLASPVGPSASPVILLGQERRKLVCDWMEKYRVGDLAQIGSDSDFDILPNIIEKIYGTDATKQDSNSDGIFDGDSIVRGIDPSKIGKIRLDNDNDGLLDNQECGINTDPFNSDTDGDGFKDGDEKTRNCDPLKSGGQGEDCHQLVLMPVPSATPLSIANSASVSPVLSPTPSSTIPYVDPKSLKIIKDNSSTAVKNYLVAVDKNSPDDLPKGSTLPTALSNALAGNMAELQKVRSIIQAYAKSLQAVSVPEVALQHHQLLLGMTMFVDQELGAIQSAEKNGDDATGYVIATNFNKVLPGYLNTLSQLRTALEAIANK